jgi:hypothetical protein
MRHHGESNLIKPAVPKMIVAVCKTAMPASHIISVLNLLVTRFSRRGISRLITRSTYSLVAIWSMISS